MFRATPQRTAETRFDAPTPMMLAEITCVVLTGACRWLAARITVAAAVSAAKPLIGRRRMILWPIVFMIRQPPDAVPRAIAVAQLTITHVGTCKVGVNPWLAAYAASAIVMMPIDFWASLDPCANAMNPAETSCRLRNPRLTVAG